MAANLEPIAQELVRWLRTKPGVSEIRPPVMNPKVSRRRLPIPLPLPKSLRGAGDPNFDLYFTYKGRPRLFRYYIEQADDPKTILDTLRVHTNGELMVRVPNEYGDLMRNDIYYANRSAAVSSLGDLAPPTAGRH